MKQRLFLHSIDLVIPEECAPGTTAEHERLHQRSFGLDGVHQIVSCPCLKHLEERDGTKRRMLCGPFQIFILHGREQDKAFLTISCKRSSKLLRSLCIACVLLVWIESLEILPCQKSSEADREVQVFR